MQEQWFYLMYTKPEEEKIKLVRKEKHEKGIIQVKICGSKRKTSTWRESKRKVNAIVHGNNLGKDINV